MSIPKIITTANSNGSQKFSFFMYFISPDDCKLSKVMMHIPYTINHLTSFPDHLNLNMSILIADSGSTKCEWCFISNGKKQIVTTQGASPYFLNEAQIVKLMMNELLPALKKKIPSRIYFYGTGCAAPANRAVVRR